MVVFFGCFFLAFNPKIPTTNGLPKFPPSIPSPQNATLPCPQLFHNGVFMSTCFLKHPPPPSPPLPDPGRQFPHGFIFFFTKILRVIVLYLHVRFFESSFFFFCCMSSGKGLVFETPEARPFLFPLPPRFSGPQPFPSS